MNIPTALSMTHLRMDHGANARAIEAYIKSRIAKLGLRNQILEEEALRTATQAELIAKADGMYVRRFPRSKLE